jgi:hypothetical protein
MDKKQLNQEEQLIETPDMITESTNKGVRNFLISIPAALAVISVLAFILQYVFFFRAQNDNLNMEKSIASNKSSLENIHSSNASFAAKKLKEIYSASELTAVTEKYRSYSMTLGGKEITSDSFSFPAGTVELKLTETSEPSSFPYEIESYGSLTDKTTSVKLWSFVNIAGVSPKAKTVDKDTIVTYKITGKSGETVRVNLSPVLVDRLGIKYNSISVKFN